MHHTNVSTMFSDPCNPNEFTTDCHHGYCEVQESGVPHCHCFDGWVDQGQQKCNKKEATTAGPDPTTAKPDPTTVKPDPTTPPAPGPCNSILVKHMATFSANIALVSVFWMKTVTSNVHAIKDGQEISAKMKNNNEIDTIEK